jgi:hypothetical protein
VPQSPNITVGYSQREQQSVVPTLALALAIDKKGRQAVEGMSPMFIWGVLLSYLAILVLAMTSLVAFGLLLARRTRAARIVFAAGLVCPALATLPVFLTWFGDLAAHFRSGDSAPLVLVVLAELSILVAGFGQFMASLKNARAYARSLGCALGATFLVAVAGLSGAEFGFLILGGQLASTLTKLPLELVGLFMAVASLMIAILSPSGAQQASQQRQK